MQGPLQGAPAAACLSLCRHYAAQPALAPAAAYEPQGPLPIAQQTTQGEFQSYVVPIYNLEKQQVGEYTLSGDIFDVPIRKDILHRVVRWQLARRQQVGGGPKGHVCSWGCRHAGWACSPATGLCELGWEGVAGSGDDTLGLRDLAGAHPF